MIASILSSYLLAATVASAAATPPPTITRVKSSPYCTALRENVGHALPGFDMNDKLIGMALPAIAKLSHDTVIGAHVASANSEEDQVRPSVRLDYSRMESIGGALTHNLDVLDKIIGDQRFKAGAAGPDGADLSRMQQQLRAVEKAQRTALNVLMAMSDTGQLAELKGMKNPLSSMLGPSGKGGADSSFATGPLGTSPNEGFNAQKALEDEHFITEGPYGGVYRALREVQAEMPTLESELAKTVITGAQSCR